MRDSGTGVDRAVCHRHFGQLGLAHEGVEVRAVGIPQFVPQDFPPDREGGGAAWPGCLANVALVVTTPLAVYFVSSMTPAGAEGSW